MAYTWTNGEVITAEKLNQTGSSGGLQKVKTVVGSNKNNVTINADTQKTLGLSSLSFYDADNDMQPLDNLPDYDLAIIKKIQLPNLAGVIVSQYDIEKDIFFVYLKNLGSASQTLTAGAFQIVATLFKVS